jgi:hydroxymethylbilane synthase
LQATLRIGTRGSKLALAQAHEVKSRLLAAHKGLSDSDIDIIVLSTKGDRILDRALAEIGGKGLFTEEIEAGLLDKSLDIAVHSLKDMPTHLPEGLILAAMLEREDPRDAFISPNAKSLQELPAGSVVGTSSLRRQAQILHLRPDLKVITYRGNVQSRLRKLAEGEVAATLLAVAGLKRLGLAQEITSIIRTDDMLPAVAQGAITIEARTGDTRILDLLAPLDHKPTALCVGAERALLGSLDGSCRTPIAALATITGNRLSLRARLISPDGRKLYETSREGPAEDGENMGRDAGDELRGKAGPAFFSMLKELGHA